MRINRHSAEASVRDHGRFFADQRAGCIQFNVAQPGARALIAKFHDACEFMVPVGYQDETGFHYGKIEQAAA